MRDGVSELERRYRRLLALYPRDHRRRHGEEMLDVLVAAAGERTRPGARDTADLLWGALRLHLRRVVAADGDVDPRAVLAIVSLLGPVAILAGATTSLHELAWWVQIREVPPFEQLPDAPVWFVWLAVAVLAVLGRRWPAAVGAWAGTVGLVLLATVSPTSWQWTTAQAGWVLLGALTALALTVSPGPARGRELAGRWPVAVMAGTVLVFVGLGVLGYGGTIAGWAGLVVLVIGAVAAAGVTSRNGRRAALVLLVPVITTVIAVLVETTLGFRLNESVTALIFFGVPLVVLLAVGGLPRSFRRGPDEPVT